MTGKPPLPPPAPPCRAAQEAATRNCAEADRLAEMAQVAAADLGVARRQRGELVREMETDARLGDRRALTAAKRRALTTYRTDYEHAHDGGAVMVATAKWLSDVSSMNQRARRAIRESESLTRRQADVDALVERLQLAADAARIAAASAREPCVDARRTLAACQEATSTVTKPNWPTLQPTAPSQGSATAAVATAAPAADSAIGDDQAWSSEPPIEALLRGDRDVLRAVVGRLAEEVGLDAGRLQLLMLDLRDAVISAGRTACAYNFAPRHTFWSQFTLGEARAVAAALATLGRRFDGKDGWYGGVVATPREMAMAISLAGREPRSVRPQPSQSDIDTLWAGTTVAAVEFLFTNAPDLRVEALMGLLGKRADALNELWDNWGRVRPTLLGT